MQDRQGAGRHLSAVIVAGLLPLLAANAPVATHDVTVTVTDLRSSDGKVLACITAEPRAFPNCDRDPKAIAVSVDAAQTVRFTFRDVAEGEYAISLLHDENGNGKADRTLMIPKEGFGFSRDAKLRLGPPSFSSAAFQVQGGGVHQNIRMRYLFR